MKNNLLKKLSREPLRSIVFLLSLLVARLAIQIALYRAGFISVAADEFARGIRAAVWAESPQINLLADVQGTWLPFEKYLNGLLLIIWPEVILAPRLTVFIASCLLIIAIYWLTYFLFNRFAIAFLTTVFITFQPWFVWLSGTPMLEMYYFAFFFAGLYFLISWLETGRGKYWLWAGISFLLSSGFHVQSWTLINFVFLLTLPSFINIFRQKAYQRLWRLAAIYVLGNGLILSFALIEYLNTGQVFAFLENHTSYSRWFYDGYNVSVMEKFLYYPRLIYQNASLTLWIGLGLALFFLVKDRQRIWKFAPFILAALVLMLNSTMNIFSGPPSAAPARYSLFYILIFSIYVGYGTFHLFNTGWNLSGGVRKYLFMTVAAFIFVFGIWWGADRIPNYPKGMALDAVEIGHELNALLDHANGTYMVELIYWEFLAVNLTSRHYDQIVFDRVRDNRDRNTLSIFLQNTAALCEGLKLPDLRYVVLRDDDLKHQAQSLGILTRLETVGNWTIYGLDPEFNSSGNLCG